MSHFSTLVTIEKAMEMDPKEIPNELERRLAPFMENCCGEPDKIYMKFYDEEDNMLEQYEKEGREMVVMPDGRLLLPWDNEFRKEFKKGDNPLDRFAQPKAPEDLPRKIVPFKETYSTFEEFAKEWHGRAERDETYNRYGYWQNPNAKWDWFEVGGRWAGFFQLRPGHTGGLGKRYNYGSIKESKNRADIAFKLAIDWETMRRQKEEAAAKEYDAVWAILKSTPEAESWEEVRSEFDLNKEGEIEKARAKYHAQPRVKALNKFSMTEEGREIVGFFTDVEAYQIPREQFLLNARNGAGMPFAILHNGQWIEHGEMGWFGCITQNEKDPETWKSMAAKLIDELPGDTLLVLCDCHI